MLISLLLSIIPIMKVAHRNPNNNIELDQPIVSLLRDGKQWEKDDPEKAVALYEKMIHAYPHKALLYDRLMIVFRKTGELQKELKLLNAAIKFFQALHDKAHTRKASKKITQLSNAIAKLTGLKDSKKKDLTSLPQPMAKWHKRKALLLKKMKPLKK